jgi:putative transposase
MRWVSDVMPAICIGAGRYASRRFRTFNVLDEGNREALAIEFGASIPSARVMRVLDDLVRLYGRARVRVDEGPRPPN